MWWSFGFERHNIFLINNMLFSLPHWPAADATGTSGPPAINALLSDSVLVRQWHFLQQHALSRVQQRCSKPTHTHSTSSPSILHTRSSFHTRHFHHRHPYTRLQHRL
mmetsp:Transcript_76301/g.151228  ORF Transcript_76301/g.151228 Transcript_76301/m.151228 type:complete len:107 (-) Transcript_76301:22-342(-)